MYHKFVRNFHRRLNSLDFFLEFLPFLIPGFLIFRFQFLKPGLKFHKFSIISHLDLLFLCQRIIGCLCCLDSCLVCQSQFSYRRKPVNLAYHSLHCSGAASLNGQRPVFLAAVLPVHGNIQYRTTLHRNSPFHRSASIGFSSGGTVGILSNCYFCCVIVSYRKVLYLDFLYIAAYLQHRLTAGGAGIGHGAGLNCIG